MKHHNSARLEIARCQSWRMGPTCKREYSGCLSREGNHAVAATVWTIWIRWGEERRDSGGPPRFNPWGGFWSRLSSPRRSRSQRVSLPLPFVSHQMCQWAALRILSFHPCRSGESSSSKDAPWPCTQAHPDSAWRSISMLQISMKCTNIFRRRHSGTLMPYGWSAPWTWFQQGIGNVNGTLKMFEWTSEGIHPNAFQICLNNWIPWHCPSLVGGIVSYFQLTCDKWFRFFCRAYCNTMQQLYPFFKKYAMLGMPHVNVIVVFPNGVFWSEMLLDWLSPLYYLHFLLASSDLFLINAGLLCIFFVSQLPILDDFWCDIFDHQRLRIVSGRHLTAIATSSTEEHFWL